MNFERFEFKEQELDMSQVRGVLHCLLHSILFNRSLGPFQPKDAECAEIDNMPYAKLDEVEVDKKVDGFIDGFVSSWRKSGSARANVCLGFYELQAQPTKKFWPLGNKEEKGFWEKWMIPLATTTPVGVAAASAAQQTKNAAQQQGEAVAAARYARLHEALVYIVESINEKRDHIPVKSVPSPLYFHFELSFTFGGKTDSGWGLSAITNILKQRPPMLLS